MKNHTEMIAIFQSTGLVPLFSHEDGAVAQQMVQACYRGGARVIEFTNRKSNALDVFSDLVKQRRNYPAMKLGIGTVMDADTTQKFIDAGADFIVAPILKPAMAEVCLKNSIPWIPGCATLTEIVTARDLGASVIKVFPGSVLGPNFLSSILPVVPDLKLMVTGGVELNEPNLRGWFKAGALCVGLGSHLFKSENIKAKAWDKVEADVSEALSIIKKIKSDLTS
jgi:2-dehydro-3-deoxyphosphogluconate aldolase / (4S)-4-hydroxy-2-oxoglutarate aldolase